MTASRLITIELRTDDAEPMLRQAAYEAARYSAWLDYCHSKVGNHPKWYGISLADWRKVITERFLRAKRIVEAFGVEYDPTSEDETLTVAYHAVGGKTTVRDMPGIGKISVNTGSKPDYDHPYPSYRGEVHNEACHAAAERVVRRWRALQFDSKR